MGRPSNAEMRARKKAKKEAEQLASSQLQKEEQDNIMKNQANSKRGNPKSEINLKELDDKLQEQTDSSIDGGGSSGGEKNIDDDFTDENPEINMDESHRFEMPEEDDNFDRDRILKDDFVFDESSSGAYDPLEEPVIKRSYTTGNVNPNPQTAANPNGSTTIAQPFIEPIIQEPVIKVPPVIDPNAQTSNAGGGNNNGNGGSGNNTANPNPNFDPNSFNNSNNPNNNNGTTVTPAPKTSVNPETKDMSPKQKRDAAEKAADAFLLAYAKVIPIIPKKVSSFNMRKLQKMEMEDSLDLSLIAGENNNGEVTVKEFCEDVNRQVEEVFTITDEMKQEIKEPLVDVLMENDIALTPTQRLIMAVGGQIVQMGFSTIQFMNQNKHALKMFAEWHREAKEDRIVKDSSKHSARHAAFKESKRQEDEELDRFERNQRNAHKQDLKETANNEPVDLGEKINMDEVIKETVNEKKFDSPIASQNTEIKKDTLASNQKLNMHDVLSEENGGITVEEEPNE